LQGFSVGISGDGEYIVTGHGGYDSSNPITLPLMCSLMLCCGTHYAAGNGTVQILKYDTNAGSSMMVVILLPLKK
jgi:hypothetical protein